MGVRSVTAEDINRRDFLQLSVASGIASLGNALPGSRTVVAQESRTTRTTILIVLDGALSNWDSFDYKPDAASALRGPFLRGSKKTDGAVYSDLLPNLGRESDSHLLLPAMFAPNSGNHQNAYSLWLNTSGQNLITQLSTNGRRIPYVHGVIPGVEKDFSGEGEEFPSTRALHIAWDEDKKNCELRADADRSGRLQSRRELARELDRFGGLQSEQIAAYLEHEQVAEDLLVNGIADVTLKPDRENLMLEKEFGDHAYGRILHLSYNIADKLKAGIVTIRTGDWDDHYGLLAGMERLRKLDQALAALIRHARDRHTIVVRGEFGRTPTFHNHSEAGGAGRNHDYIHAALLAGPTIRNGQYGSTSKRFEILNGEVKNAEFAQFVLEAAGVTPPGTAQGELAATMLKRS